MLFPEWRRHVSKVVLALSLLDGFDLVFEQQCFTANGRNIPELKRERFAVK